MNNIINIKESANRLELMDYHASIVCGNSNYILKFSFGDQWQKCNHKVAIFVINGNNLAVDFEGDECVVPVLPNASCMFVSLISGEGEKQLATTQIKIALEPTVAGDDLSEFNVYTSTLSKLIGAVNKIESGDIVANTAKNAVAAQNVSNPNILINGDFRINQRGLKTYTEHNKYTVDRWNLNYGSLTVNDDGSITHTASNSWQGIRQYIEFPSRLAGKTVTFSMKSNSSGIRLVQLSYLKKGNTVTDKIASKQENDISAEILTFSVKIPTDITDEDKLFILLYTPQANQSVTYYWTKLEVGSTPTEFIPRLYGEELALCQRYYQKIKGLGSANIFGFGSLRMATNARFEIVLNNQLRGLPTINANEIEILNFSTGGIFIDNLTLSLLSLNKGVVYLQVLSTENIGTSGAYVQLLGVTGNGYIELDSEIY